MLGKVLLPTATALLVFFLKLFENRIIGLFITYRNVAFFLISCMVLGLLDQLQIFLQLYLKEGVPKILLQRGNNPEKGG